MKKLLLFLFISISFNAAADDDLVEYMDNGLPKHYELLDGKTPIYIEFTDVIQGRYIVDVEWFPDWGLVPMFNGPANINFKLVDRDVKFTIKTDFFNIGNRMFSFPKYRINANTIANKEVIKMKYSDIANEPFAFGDMNFDGIKELVIANRRQGQRYHDAYEVYLIQEIEDTSYFNIMDLTDTLPYSNIDATTEFDSDNKTIQLYYSGGACSPSYETYKRVFSDYPLRDYKFELIHKIDYETWDEDGNDIPCTKYVYDVVDGKEILDEAKSGTVD
ncbi:hypothetical protein OAI40_05480 [Candidatus Pseudothioglobus singularis]|nr:hypothetical protein [Candidatus Pseudothioglobus singularis]MDB4598645.1 hypothetical protein [Candidatus Pseudothioglobus singularis]